jgi:hypothetical protein
MTVPPRPERLPRCPACSLLTHAAATWAPKDVDPSHFCGCPFDDTANPADKLLTTDSVSESEISA